MSKRKICKQCKVFYDADVCPLCKKESTANSFQGRINVIDSDKSWIAKHIGITASGEYAIKVR